ncbi:adhesin [Moraxella sp.]|uniref:ACP-like domain-containing protein n=1 Tax=Moraxella sp. TaxID=479 RepID=UPI0026DC91B6|nr:adhesin [Moraxella sp.]MDO4894524.1 adhesin [Moraxella sp.]
MKKLATITMIALAGLSTTAFAAGAQSDARTAHKNAVKTRTVTYACQDHQKVAVKYGFNKRNQPTYAEANLDGKRRFMPINYNNSDATATEFGDENNYSVLSDKITYKTARKGSIQIQSPDSTILYKNCKAVK